MTDVFYLAIAALVAAGLVAYLVTPVTAKLARSLGLMDVPKELPGAYKLHGRPTPYLGGVAIFCGLIAGSSLLLTNPNLPVPFALGGIAAALALGLLGLVDDVRPLGFLLRLTGQLVAATLAYVVGFTVQLFPWEVLNLLITVLWIVGITNAFNLLDNMDGLSAGLAGIGALSFMVMSLAEGLPALPILTAALCGAAFGFLAHNRHPAKIFMGDAGSTFLGFLLALIGIQMRFDNLLEVTFVVPVVVLGIPILDTTIVVLSRLKHRRPVFAGARDHLSHRLVRVGVPVRAAVGILYFWAACLGWLGLVISGASPTTGWMLLALVFAMAVFFGALLWKVPVYEDGGAVARIPIATIDPDEARRSRLEPAAENAVPGHTSGGQTE